MMGLFWRIWAVFLVLSIVWLGWCMKTSPPAEAQMDVLETISAREFRLVDDQGEIRAMLATLPNGAAGLVLNDAQGKPRAVLEEYEILKKLDAELARNLFDAINQ